RALAADALAEGAVAARRAHAGARVALPDLREVGALLGEAVDGAVAVVVLAVADLGRRALAGAVDPVAGRAGLDARLGLADARAARAGQVLVDLAVAVVVEVVAELDRAAGRARALVDGAVAVVVEVVADLVGRGAARLGDLADHAGALRIAHEV